MTKQELIKMHGIGNCITRPVGGGEWAIDVYGLDGNFLFELVGSNGTREPADDIWRELEELERQAGH